jgi:hypothetical protein
LTDNRSDGDEEIILRSVIRYFLTSAELGGYRENMWAKSKLKNPSISDNNESLDHAWRVKGSPLSDPSPNPLTSSNNLSKINFLLGSSSSIGFLPSADFRAFWNGATACARSSSDLLLNRYESNSRI